MDWSLREGYAWAEDKEHCEEYGRMLNADPNKVSARAKKRGLPQMGTLGAGNHYAEIQVVDEIHDDVAAAKMGIDRIGQIMVMIHSGSRGLGHQVATDALTTWSAPWRATASSTTASWRRRIDSPEGRITWRRCRARRIAWVNRCP